jgi:hypothetical protein
MLLLLLPLIVSKFFDDNVVFCSLNIVSGCGSNYSAALRTESFLCTVKEISSFFFSVVYSVVRSSYVGSSRLIYYGVFFIGNIYAGVLTCRCLFHDSVNYSVVI